MNKTAETMANLLCGEVPWNRGQWHGELLTFDGTDTSDFNEEDIKKLWKYYCDNPDDWDGKCAAVFKLKDGRWVAYESSWGPTGSGFSEDAYGGGTNIYFAKTKKDAEKFGISQDVRKLMIVYKEDKIKGE